MKKSTMLLICLICLAAWCEALRSVSAAECYMDKQLNKMFYYQDLYIDKRGKIILISPRKSDCHDFSDNLALTSDNRACSFINRSGKKLVGDKFAIACSFSEGLAVAGERGSFGFIDTAGKFVISPFFEFAKSFHEGRAPVEIQGNWGFVDKSGKLVIDPLYESAGGFSEGLAPVEIEHRIGFIDREGNWKIHPRFDYVFGFHNGICLVMDPSSTLQKKFYIDTNGNPILTLDPVHNKGSGYIDSSTDIGLRKFMENSSGVPVDPSSFSQGLAAFPVDGRYGYIDTSTKLAIPPRFDRAFPFAEDLARVKADGSFGFIDKSGSYVIQPQFADAHDFSEGQAAVANSDHKWGYIDKSGKFVIDQKYSYAQPFSDGLAHVRMAGMVWK